MSRANPTRAVGGYKPPNCQTCGYEVNTADSKTSFVVTCNYFRPDALWFCSAECMHRTFISVAKFVEELLDEETQMRGVIIAGKDAELVA